MRWSQFWSSFLGSIKIGMVLLLDQSSRLIRPLLIMSRVHNHLECATATDKRLVLLGDFNIDQQTQSDKIEKFESEFGITQLITCSYSYPQQLTLYSQMI